MSSLNKILMKSISGKLFLIGFVQFVLFILIFKALENDKIYHATLGNFSSNYTRVKVDGETQIQQIKAPFVSLTNDHFENWDADIYRSIKDHLYSKDEGIYTNVRGAFFPLFPLIWKFSGLNNIGISVLNYFLFIIALILLLQRFLKIDSKEKLIVFSILTSLPSIIIYGIPYTEALFIFTMAFMIIGHAQNKYWLYFLAALAMAMLRPASSFILLAIIAVDVLCLFSHRNFILFFKTIAKKVTPFASGLVLAILIQYASSSSMSTMSEAQKYWDIGIGLFRQISDWSLEGFGLNAFSVFFVAFPALLFVLYILIQSRYFKSFFNKETLSSEQANRYYFLVSLFYLSGILVFIFLTTAGNLHSFFRFTMTSPAFYICMLVLLNYLADKKTKQAIPIFAVPFVLLILFLINTEYGGSRMNFSLAGMYLAMLSFCLVYFRKYLSYSLQWIMAAILVLSSLIWNAYMLNVFLTEGWIFT